MNKVVCWWSGGVTSAVACKVAFELYGPGACRVIMIDTGNEHEDTYRFKKDCERWYGKEIEVITAIGSKYKDIYDVWESFESLNVAKGAICSTELKRAVRERWQSDNEYDSQVFGFEFNKKEMNRALSLAKIQKVKAIFPLLMLAYDKKDCIDIIERAGIRIPESYRLGFHNNNCLKTGCVQGGIGYWQKMQRDFPDKFDLMAAREHILTELKGQPVTMLKDQGKDADDLVRLTGIKYMRLVFLKKHPKYPGIKCLADMPAQEVKPLTECTGFCGMDLLTPKNETKKELNYENI